MSLFQFGNTLIDLGDIVLASREGDVTVLKMRGGHEVSLDGDAGVAVWKRLAGGLIDQMPRFHPTDLQSEPVRN